MTTESDFKGNGVKPIPLTIEDLFEMYPITKVLLKVKSIVEWNAARELLKKEVPEIVINFIDTSGLVDVIKKSNKWEKKN